MNDEQEAARMKSDAEMTNSIQRLAEGLNARCTPLRTAVYLDRLAGHGIAADIVDDVCERMLDTRDKFPSPAALLNECKLTQRHAQPAAGLCSDEQRIARIEEMQWMLPHGNVTISKFSEKVAYIRGWFSELECPLSDKTQQNARRFSTWSESELRWWHITTIAERCTVHLLEA